MSRHCSRVSATLYVPNGVCIDSLLANARTAELF